MRDTPGDATENATEEAITVPPAVWTELPGTGAEILIPGDRATNLVYRRKALLLRAGPVAGM
jgi:hypothetical protein